VDGDEYHAPRLGISPQDHRLLHELAHHMIGAHCFQKRSGSPVIWRDAHGIPQPPGVSGPAEIEEWYVTALSYYLCGREPDWGAILDMSKSTMVTELVRQVHYMLECPFPVLHVPAEMMAPVEAEPDQMWF
jgi:hypothetical protein